MDENYADSIVNTLREPLLVLDSKLRIKIASPSFYRKFHVTKEQTVGRTIYEIGNHQWDNPALRKLLEEILPSDGEFNDFFIEHQFPTIGRRMMLLNARRLHDGDKTALILLAIEDITERRRAELEIARQRTWFETTLSSIGDAVIATDAESCVTFLNPTAEIITGWKSDQAKGQQISNVFNIVNEETRKTVESPVTKAIRLGSIVGLANHTLLIARDGAERPIDDSAAPIRDESQNITGVVLVFHDITERREAERRIETSEARYRRLFEAAHDGILILDTQELRIIDINRFLMELLGHPHEHFIGKQLWEIGVFTDIQASKNAMLELKDKGYVRYEDLPLQDRDGRQIPVEFVCNRYHEDGTVVFQCNIRDIRDRKQIEREREALLAQEHAARVEAQASERANRSKDHFLATLSHEMRTPLNAILGWAAILRKENCSPQDLREGIEIIDRNARAQAKLIEDVIDVSRIVSGKLNLDITPCDLKAVVHAAIETVCVAANAKGIDIELEMQDAAARGLWCDANRIQQVIWNLLSNAIKFSPSDSKVKVAIRRQDSHIHITVADNGQGIDPDFLPYAFDRFRQADSTTRRKAGGLGLGLSIVKHLVELHGGTVHAESKGKNKGSTFIVTLPLRAMNAEVSGGDDAKSVGEVKKPEPPSVRLDGLNLLVVDDELDSRRLAARVLEDAGAKVTVAATVREALAGLKKNRPNLLISDLSMPEEDGFDLIRQVRDLGYNVQQLPAIALTAFADKGYARSALLGGYQMHLPKPLDPPDLVAAVASLSGRIVPNPD